MKAHERSRLGIGYVPQGRGILPGLTALENLRLAWTPDSGETEPAAIERIVDTLPRLAAAARSQGRGAVGRRAADPGARPRADARRPGCCCSTSRRKASSRRSSRRSARSWPRLRKRDRLSLVVVEQNLDLVLDVADRIVVVERGRIEREVDAHTAQAGGLAELLGMGDDAA